MDFQKHAGTGLITHQMALDTDNFFLRSTIYIRSFDRDPAEYLDICLNTKEQPQVHTYIIHRNGVWDEIENPLEQRAVLVKKKLVFYVIFTQLHK